ncbi:MAG: molecular chaperone TorD family protein [candidate division KSB1 bacterium]|nr:molecular chaperone TorD family protein [candidate division KSB1 bacterium]MDZ7300699.1 molecular chaperone TorD family protein [candidate division KSB1 bacterium]MDZ7310031.1 molecular chaperone TorD family protein [candidate division KSB1 bacterium]
METLTHTFAALARILSYPAAEYKHHVAHCRDLCATLRLGNAEARREALSHLDSFRAAIERLTLEELEELYTQTFDLNPISSLDLGWHLYGETYERGKFLVQMRDLLRRHEIAESTELPDHLTHVLLVVGRMERKEAAELVSTRVLKALDKMLEGFTGKENPYEHVLTAAKLLLHETYRPTSFQETTL